MAEQGHLIYLNGLNATNGRPLIKPVSDAELAKRVLDLYSPQQIRSEQQTYSLERFAPFDEYDLADPAQVGWGLLVHADEAEVMQERLSTLIAHRNGRLLIYNGETARVWKEKNRAGAINPDSFPFYVLIAGSPEKVPFDLQYSLSVLQAVGRIDFDSADDYARYAQTVVDQERQQSPIPAKKAVFFAPHQPGDYPTGQTSQRLVRPLLKQLPDSVPADIVFDDLIGQDATKHNLLAALAPDQQGQKPAVLFSASHGAGVEATDPFQRMLQGSIVCQDHEFPLTPEQRKGFLSAYDVGEEGFGLPGGIHFFFACYGAGTRANSDFVDYVPGEEDRAELRKFQGKVDFVANLPKAMLSNPQGGALAVVGHVDPAWVHSFESTIVGTRRIHPFGLSLARLMRGNPVGFAISSFGQKYADLSTDLLSLIEDEEESGRLLDPDTFSDLWICRNDAQNYVIIGDPAVRLNFA